MPDAMKYVGQAVFYGLIALVIGYFSASPLFHQFPGGMSQIKLSFRHGGNRLEDCRKLTPEEIAKLPEKEKRPNTCSRERIPIAVKLVVDGQPLYDEVLRPTGLSGDGPAETYRKFIVPAGSHKVEAFLRDSKRQDGYDYSNTFELDLQPLQSVAIDFMADQGGFLVR